MNRMTTHPAAETTPADLVPIPEYLMKAYGLHDWPLRHRLRVASSDEGDWWVVFGHHDRRRVLAAVAADARADGTLTYLREYGGLPGLLAGITRRWANNPLDTEDGTAWSYCPPDAPGAVAVTLVEPGPVAGPPATLADLFGNQDWADCAAEPPAEQSAPAELVKIPDEVMTAYCLRRWPVRHRVRVAYITDDFAWTVWGHPEERRVAAAVIADARARGVLHLLGAEGGLCGLPSLLAGITRRWANNPTEDGDDWDFCGPDAPGAVAVTLVEPCLVNDPPTTLADLFGPRALEAATTALHSGLVDHARRHGGGSGWLGGYSEGVEHTLETLRLPSERVRRFLTLLPHAWAQPPTPAHGLDLGGITVPALDRLPSAATVGHPATRQRYLAFLDTIETWVYLDWASTSSPVVRSHGRVSLGLIGCADLGRDASVSDALHADPAIGTRIATATWTDLRNRCMPWLSNHTFTTTEAAALQNVLAGLATIQAAPTASAPIALAALQWADHLANILTGSGWAILFGDKPSSVYLSLVAAMKHLDMLGGPDPAARVARAYRAGRFDLAPDALGVRVAIVHTTRLDTAPSGQE